MRLLLLVFFSIFIPGLCDAETSVWEVRQGGQHVYIGGTVHLLSTADYPLPDEFNDVYQQSDLLVFETDIGGTSDPAFQQKMLIAASYQDGRTLKSVLNSETYTALEAYCNSIGFPLASLLSFKPGMVSMTLTLLELQRLGLAGIGVDKFFYEQAKRDNKKVMALESLETQMTFISRMGEGQENELIMKTLHEVRDIQKLIGDMKAAWRSGNRKKLETLAVLPMATDYPKLYQMILVDRNMDWLPKIKSYFKTPEVEFVLVGAAHLVGKDGLLSHLHEEGYIIKQVKPFP